jgi:NitT/TauT family transport system permease protein
VLSPGLERWLPSVVVMAALLLWEAAARRGRISTLFFPAPSIIGSTLLRLIRSGRLSENLSASLSRLLFGFVLGAFPGLVLGVLVGWSRTLRVIVDPIVAAVHPIPKVSLLPLIMIIFGIGEASKVVTIAIVCFFPMLIGSMAAVREISPIYFEVAENYGAGLRKLFARVVLPATLPLVLNTTRLSLNTAVVLTMAVELITAHRGLGALIWYAWETLRTEELYATLTVAALLGIGINEVLQRLTKALVPWHVERTR